MTWMSLSRRSLQALTLAVALIALAIPALAQTASERAKAQARETGNAVTDGWITMKVHSQFIPENALEGSDIDVDTNNGVVTLNGTVATEAGRARAVAIAKATDGVKNVTDKLRVAPAGSTASAARSEGRKAGEEAREAGREAAGAARDATGTAGRTVTNGWIKSKIYSQYLTEDALDDADIDIDVNQGVVSLNGTVRSDAGRTRAAAIAQQTDGVKSVKNNLKVSGTSTDK